MAPNSGIAAGGDAQGLISFDDEFDPLAAGEFDLNEDEMDDDNPYDTVDYPLIRNMPEGMQRDAVYSPERQGGARNATSLMLRNNPAYRPVLLALIKLCEGGCPSSEVTRQVDAWRKSNRSVYEPMTLCRMLERSGALRLEMPQTTECCEQAEDGVVYLEIKERVDPVWHATEAGLEVRAALTRGDSFRDIVLDRDSAYLEVYQALLEQLVQAPRSREFIEDLVDTFEVVKSPRRFGSHFIDMLELTDAIEWSDHAWRATALGQQMLDEVRSARKDA